jgi:L-lactate dehydrogenase complex protein LldG
MNRDNFLNTIRQSLNTTYLPDAEPQKPPQPSLPDFDPEELVAQFTQEVTVLKGMVHCVGSEETIYRCICDIFETHQASAYLSWAEDALPINNLLDRLAEQGYTPRNITIPADPEARQEALTNLSAAPVGLTGAMAGLADTGSIVLQSKPGQSRLASLLPPVHIALLQINALFPDMAHFIQAYPEAARQASNLVFITGPSRTADIEQTLTLGVHGPKELHIILI